ncbi:zinc finger protein 836-like isoform X2 [Topomyia yanbarensis]|uniref:zinc finger protein 836-like isoform X2 n=1 Tax=Topomyia yanbarensis TaxID=2498891 RepID=UPI00273B8A27|nr:zinc finger protein 836-like isoform X2 [Topomyia yanbarensis]
MKKIVQPVRKIYGTTTTAVQQQHQQQQQQQQQQSTMQMNAVRKINSLLQSGAVSVTGISGSQARMMPKKPLNNQQTSVSITTTNSYVSKQQKCYVCGDNAGINATLLTEASTATSQTEFTSKIAKIVGEGYMVIIGTDDVVCRRCITMFNQMDKLETDLEHVRNTLTSFIHRKYNILDDDPSLAPPPAKIQRLGGIGTAATTYSVKTVNDSGQEMVDVSRKSNTSGTLSDLTNSGMDIESQLTNMFEKPQQIVTQQLQPQQSQIQTTNNGANIVSSTAQQLPSTAIRRNPIKMYKCMSCDFKTQDLTQFQPHYEQCKANTNQQLVTPTSTATTTTSSAYRCKLCKKIFASVALLKQHNALEHQNPVQQPTEIKIVEQQGSGTTITQLYACNMCTYKTPDKQNYDDHLRKHIKLKPFKCRVCLMRFETREQASIHAKNHQPDYFKCGICNVTFNKRELLMKHLETHENVKKQVPVQKHTTITTVQQAPSQQQTQQITHHHQQQQQQQLMQQHQPSAQIRIKSEMPVADSSTQKLLQATIDEALRDTIGETIDAKSIQFHSCNTCSLTFLNEKLYTQHMKMHSGGAGGTPAPLTTSQTVGGTTITTSKKMVSANASTLNNGGQELHGKLLAPGGAPGSTLTTSHSISDGDLESIFEKIHSDKNDMNPGDNMVITSQDNATGNITYSITLAQQGQRGQTYVQQQQAELAENKMITQNQVKQQQTAVSIDMPTLDQGEDQQQHQQAQLQPKQEAMNMPVSMPSLDDDGEQSQNSQNSNAEGAVHMELEGIQDADGQQIKFILNENGQILQLDNHILTTDADGNQILVQGTDSEQIQQLLQSVGVVMQSGEGLGEGETLQMIGGDGQTGQMILVQGADGQEQLIDASLLNADGNIVIQQSQEGELNAEGTHITTEDGLQIPVSFTTSGEVDQEGNLTVSMAGGEGGEQQIQLHLQQADNDGDEQQHMDGSEDQQGILTEGGHIILHTQEQVDEQQKQDEENERAQTASSGRVEANTTGSGSIVGSGTSSGTTATGADEQGMFNFDELIQPQVVIKQQIELHGDDQKQMRENASKHDQATRKDDPA